MATLSASMLLPPKLKTHEDQPTIASLSRSFRPKNTHSFSPVMRLFGPSIFEASKLKVLILGVDKEKHPGNGNLPRAYTLTHSDITCQLTLAISQTINNSQLQGWYNKLQRDEVVAEWKKVKGKMSLHVHCHISGGHFLLDMFARLRYHIFCKELPVVLSAFVHGDENLFKNHPSLKEALVWVYFHSNMPEFNKLQCWGPIFNAMTHTMSDCNKLLNFYNEEDEDYELPDAEKWEMEMPHPCKEACTCCFPSKSLIPWKLDRHN